MSLLSNFNLIVEYYSLWLAIGLKVNLSVFNQSERVEADPIGCFQNESRTKPEI